MSQIAAHTSETILQAVVLPQRKLYEEDLSVSPAAKNLQIKIIICSHLQDPKWQAVDEILGGCMPNRQTNIGHLACRSEELKFNFDHLRSFSRVL